MAGRAALVGDVVELTPVGIFCLVAAAIIIARPLRLGFLVIAAFLPLQAAAAANLWAVGGMSLICAHVLIGALIFAIAIRPRLGVAAVQTSLRRTAVIVLALFTVYGLLSAFMMPRLFEGDLSVYSLERTTKGYIALSSLRPSTGNISQPFYVFINFCFFAVAAFALSRPGGLVRATHAFNAVTIVHIAFGVISAAPNLAPNAALLDFIRTANYSINDHHTIAGTARLIGSYTEPASFGAMSAGLFAWNFVRFMQTRGVWHFSAACVLLACVALSFSTTAYATLFLLVGLWGLHAVYSAVRRGITSDHITAFTFGLILLAAFTSLFLLEPVQQFGAYVFERLFGSKLQSASGAERGAWNMQSLRNFVDTFGLGVGLGSARASSLATALLGNMGVIGAGLFAIFLNRSFLRPWARRSLKTGERDVLYARRIFSAARAGGLSLLLSMLIAGTVVDTGLMFVMFAAVAAAAYVPARREKSIIEVAPIGGRNAISSLWGPRQIGGPAQRPSPG